MKHMTDTDFILNPLCFKVVLITVLSLTALKSENFCSFQNISNESLTYYSVLPINFRNDLEESLSAKSRVFRLQNFHPLDCETNVPIMQMANGRLPAMVTRSVLPNL